MQQVKNLLYSRVMCRAATGNIPAQPELWNWAFQAETVKTNLKAGVIELHWVCIFFQFTNNSTNATRPTLKYVLQQN